MTDVRRDYYGRLSPVLATFEAPLPDGPFAADSTSQFKEEMGGQY
jgi:hypothetical protein